jgi:hypothetical protein
VPVGFRMNTIVYWARGGVNQALEEWGSVMRKFYQVGPYSQFMYATSAHKLADGVEDRQSVV